MGLIPFGYTLHQLGIIVQLHSDSLLLEQSEEEKPADRYYERLAVTRVREYIPSVSLSRATPFLLEEQWTK